jgi:hypothetical protein
MGLLDWLRSKRPAPDAPSKLRTVRVPEGFRVVVVHASPRSDFGRLPGGEWVCNLGRGGDRGEVVASLLDAAEAAMKRSPEQVAWVAGAQRMEELFEARDAEVRRVSDGIVWIAQNGSLRGWVEDPARLFALLVRVHRVVKLRGPSAHRQHTFVLADETFPNAGAFAALLAAMDLGVRSPGPDGAVLVQVQRPDDSAVLGLLGTPAKPITLPEADALRQLLRDRARAEDLAEGDDALAALDARGTDLVSRVIAREGSEGEPDPWLHNAPLRRLLKEVADEGDAPRKKLYDTLLHPSTVLLLSSSAQMRSEESTGVYPRVLPHPKAGTLVLAFTDLEAWEKAELAGDDLVPVSGRELFACAQGAGHGVIVNPSGPDYVGVTGAHVEALARGENPLGG